MTSFKTKKISKIPQYYNEEKRENHEIIEEKTRKKRATGKIFRRFISVLLILSSLLFLGVLGAKELGKTNLGGNETEAWLFQPILSLIDTENNTEIIKEEKKGIKNILVAGIGGKGEPGHVGSELTDSLMLVNLNYDTKEVILLTLPRDLYVAYSSNTAGKINAMYQMKKDGEGINFLAQKVSEITGQPIHYYAVIDFSGFRSIVDALGGIEIDVPRNLYDNQYPNNNWGYQIVNIKKWLQTMDGETALKYARSRKTTSDFDRSERQKLVIKAIKDKALTLGILGNPAKITELIESVRNHLSTNLTIGDLTNIALEFKDIDNKNIVSYTINNECNGACPPGAYLYQPSMEAFGGEWVVIPEWASKSRLSKYDRIRRYVGNIFTHPHLKDQEKVINIITSRKNITQARNLRTGLEKLGFALDHTKSITQTGAVIENTEIIAYYDETTQMGFDENHIIISALKNIEPNIKITYQPKNLYITDKWPQIEILIGNDIKKFFDFSTPVPYLEKQASASDNITTTKTATETTNTTTKTATGTTNTTTKTATGSTNTTKTQTGAVSENKTTNTTQSDTTTNKTTKNIENTTQNTPENQPAEYQFQAGEWENF